MLLQSGHAARLLLSIKAPVDTASAALASPLQLPANPDEIVHQSDPIVTIEKGRLVKDTEHDRLLQAGGRYASWWRLRNGEHGLAANG